MKKAIRITPRYCPRKFGVQRCTHILLLQLSSGSTLIRKEGKLLGMLCVEVWGQAVPATACCLSRAGDGTAI